MMKSTKTQQKNTTKADLYVLLPVLFALCIIPLVILTHDYETAFSSFEWFNNEELSQIDSFEYAKGILVTITGAAAAMILFVHEYHAIQKKKRLFANADLKICILWAIYPIMALISGIFSKYTDLAFTGGGYGQWQTVWVLCSYSILFMYAYTFIDTENRAILTIKCMMVTTGLLALLGFLQSIDHNPLKWEWVQKIMTSQSATESVTFKDGVSSVILAFNNPNYVGPYVAMVLPIVIAFIFIRSSKNKITSILCRVAGVLISISFVIILKGADSSAGLIATTVGIVFAGLLLLTGLFPKKNMPPAENDEQDESSKKKNKTGLIIGLCAVAVLCVGLLLWFKMEPLKTWQIEYLREVKTPEMLLLS